VDGDGDLFEFEASSVAFVVETGETWLTGKGRGRTRLISLRGGLTDRASLTMEKESQESVPYWFRSCKLLNPPLSLHSKHLAICCSSSVSHTHASIGNFHWLLMLTFPSFASKH
jgi:hypothetical protein